jgi:hypothetical protein
MHARWFVTTMVLVIGSSPVRAESFSVTLKVLDVDKKPVAKAEAAFFWTAKDGAMTASSDKPMLTDAAGKVVLSVDNWNQKRALLVLSADRALGGIIGVSKEDDGKELMVTMGATIRVKGKLECKELNSRPQWANTIVTVDGVRPQFTQDITTSASLDFVLPAGKYTFRSYGTDVEGATQTATLSADWRAHDLGTLDLKASAIARLRGKVPPDWVIADIRGAKSDAKLADYKGKWVYIEFWGFW